MSTGSAKTVEHGGGRQTEVDRDLAHDAARAIRNQHRVTTCAHSLQDRLRRQTSDETP